MKNTVWSIIGITIVILLILAGFSGASPYTPQPVRDDNEGGPGLEEVEPLTVAAMRSRLYPGSKLTVVENLADGSNYKRQIVSYESDDLTINALLTIPKSTMPPGGYPAIVFNHGYIPPEEYHTTERYIAYVDGFATSGYVVFRPDYRGHGSSEGTPEGAYYSPGYTVDVLNALTSVQKLPIVNPDAIGMWGHSLGGHITIKAMVISEDIKAGVIWAGVVASHEDMYRNWRRRPTWTPSQREVETRRSTRQKFIEKYGEPEANPQFWRSISPIYFVSDISGPVQLHHGLADETIPASFSASLKDALVSAGKMVEYYEYKGADHNLSQVFGTAMQRSIEFFDKHLKQ